MNWGFEDVTPAIVSLGCLVANVVLLVVLLRLRGRSRRAPTLADGDVVHVRSAQGVWRLDNGTDEVGVEGSKSTDPDRNVVDDFLALLAARVTAASDEEIDRQVTVLTGMDHTVEDQDLRQVALLAKRAFVAEWDRRHPSREGGA